MKSNNIILQLTVLINEAISQQLQAILHHPEFQSLEASWRGLAFVLRHARKNRQMILKVLPLSKKELCDDLLIAEDIEHSALFKKIYSEEFDHPGGQPFGVLLGDFYFSHQRDEVCADSISVLRAAAQIGAAAFVPFLFSVDSRLLGLNAMNELTPLQSLSELHQQQEYQRWNRLRQEETMRFVVLFSSRKLLRPLHVRRGFLEKAKSHQDYLWGSSIFAYASVLMDHYIEHGWFANVRGSISKIPPSQQSYFRSGFSRISSEVFINDAQEKECQAMGLMALREHCFFDSRIFYSAQTFQKGSILLDDLLCVARFGHTIKVMMRDKIGRFANAEEIEQFLQAWLNAYCVESSASVDMKLKCPLQSAQVSIRNQVGRGHFSGVIDLKPHESWERLSVPLRLITHFMLGQGS